MIRLKSIYIKGFKDPTYEKKLVFSEEPISVIFGENGSGKTTLLKILFGVLSRDADVLLKEKVREIHIEYSNNGESKKADIFVNESGEIKWNKDSDLNFTNSILCGVHRGIIQEENNYPKSNRKRILYLLNDFLTISHRIIPSKQLLSLFNPHSIFELEKLINKKKSNLNEITYLLDKIISEIDSPRDVKGYEKLKQIYKELQYYSYANTYKNEQNDFLKKIYTNSHLSSNFVQIKDIQDVIIDQCKKGQNSTSDKIKNALFETIEKAIEIDETNEDFPLPDDFDERIETNKDFILKAIVKEDSSLAKRVQRYLETRDKTLTEKSKIFRAMLLNIIESAEEPNPELEAITTLVEIFNEHLYGNKKLVIDSEKAYIGLEDGKFHELSELSSGERNLLSILTLFLIIGKDRNFLLIDEPEISFNIKWQRKFLPLLNRLNSNAQIIVASHSPSISHENSNYLVELK